MMFAKTKNQTVKLQSSLDRDAAKVHSPKPEPQGCGSPSCGCGPTGARKPLFSDKKPGLKSQE